MLRLVHPAKPQGQEKRARYYPSGSLTPTKEECQRIKAVIHTLARMYGGYDVLANVMGVHINTLTRAGKRASYAIAIAAARAGGISVEQVLSGRLSIANVCPTCGARKGAR